MQDPHPKPLGEAPTWSPPWASRALFRWPWGSAVAVAPSCRGAGGPWCLPQCAARHDMQCDMVYFPSPGAPVFAVKTVIRDNWIMSLTLGDGAAAGAPLSGCLRHPEAVAAQEAPATQGPRLQGLGTPRGRRVATRGQQRTGL